MLKDGLLDSALSLLLGSAMGQSSGVAWAAYAGCVDREFITSGYVHPGFTKELSALGPGVIFLDSGAGVAEAGADYCELPELEGRSPTTYRKDAPKFLLPPPALRADVVSVDLHYPVTHYNSYDRIQLRVDKLRAEGRLEYIETDVTNLPILRPDLRGKVTVILDVKGALIWNS